MAHDQARLHRAADEPPFVRRRHEAHCRVMEPSQPSADLDQRRVAPHPCRPRCPVADRVARQVGEHLAALIIKAQRPRSAVEADILQVPQQCMHRGRPGRGWLVDDVTDQHGARGETARQALFGHTVVYRILTRAVGDIGPGGDRKRPLSVLAGRPNPQPTNPLSCRAFRNQWSQRDSPPFLLRAARSTDEVAASASRPPAQPPFARTGRRIRSQSRSTAPAAPRSARTGDFQAPDGSSILLARFSAPIHLEPICLTNHRDPFKAV